MLADSESYWIAFMVSDSYLVTVGYRIAFCYPAARFTARQGQSPEQSPERGRLALDCERFRAAPAYDFAVPPHIGRLHYEDCNWGMTGERWRELARMAQAQLHSA